MSPNEYSRRFSLPRVSVESHNAEGRIPELVHGLRVGEGLLPGDVAPQVDLVDGQVPLVLRVVRTERRLQQHPEPENPGTNRIHPGNLMTISEGDFYSNCLP